MKTFTWLGCSLLFVTVLCIGADSPKPLDLDGVAEVRVTYRPTVESIEEVFNSLKGKLKKALKPEEFARLESAFQEERLEAMLEFKKLEKGEYKKSKLMTAFKEQAFDVETELGEELNLDENRDETIFDDIYDYCNLYHPDFLVEEDDVKYKKTEIYWNRIYDKETGELKAYIAFVYMPVVILVSNFKPDNVCEYPLGVRIYDVDQTDPTKLASVSYRGETDQINKPDVFKKLIKYMK